ncbi:hypothetical protein GGI42DRAFT_318961 [Trichoderma sp. SZMC 28013]
MSQAILTVGIICMAANAGAWKAAAMLVQVSVQALYASLGLLTRPSARQVSARNCLVLALLPCLRRLVLLLFCISGLESKMRRKHSLGTSLAC